MSTHVIRAFLSRLRRASARRRTKPSVEEYISNYRKQPDKAFERYLRKTLAVRGSKGITDLDTISPDWKLFEGKYHYNLVENAVIDICLRNKQDFAHCHVLDVGSGSGHWIDFYISILAVRSVTAVEFCEPFFRHLQNRFAGDDRVHLVQADITDPSLQMERRFDITNAIGVMFHIVDDGSWALAISNLATFSRRGAIAIFGECFGIETRTVEPSIAIGGPIRRIRSLKMWKEALESVHFEHIEVRRFKWFKGWNGRTGIMDNVLACRKR
jgi:SAM-dependent methyltransferase